MGEAFVGGAPWLAAWRIRGWPENGTRRVWAVLIATRLPRKDICTAPEHCERNMKPVLIAGGGIGGLTLAISLARHGIASHILEARPALTREGAGIQLGPNATRILQTLDVTPALGGHVVSPEYIAVNDGRSGHELTRLPLGAWLEERHGAPYWVVHRAALHDALQSAVAKEPLVTLEMGRALVAIDDAAGLERAAITAHVSDGGDATGSILVGADGLWSRARAHVAPAAKLTYSGMVAARARVARDAAGTPFSGTGAAQRAGWTGVWLAPNAHIVHYPVEGGDQIALVAICKLAEPSDGWSTQIGTDEIARRFGHMPDAITQLLKKADNWQQWPLFTLSKATHWSRGRCVLIGDAAHPILPFLAQGGALAIEDAFELAGAIGRARRDPACAIKTFVNHRRQRVAGVQAASAANGRTYHLDGAGAFARNMALRLAPRHALMKRYDWIYGYRSG